MKALSDSVQKALDTVRAATGAHPILSFAIDSEPSPAPHGWRVGSRRDGAALVVTPTRRAMIIDGGERVRLFDWLRRELVAAEKAATELSDDDALALVGAPASAEDLCARLTDGALPALAEEELLDLLGADHDRDFDLDEPPKLEDWLPEDVDRDEALAWRRVWSDDEVTLLLGAEGFVWLHGAEIERLDLRKAALRVLARPRRESLVEVTRALKRQIPEPFSWLGAVGLGLLLSPFTGLGSLVGGVFLAAVFAVAGFALSTAGVAIPDPPSVSWIIGAPAVGLFVGINVYLALVGARD